MSCILFIPIYKERVWGGRRLETRLKRELPGEGPYGESWEIVDRSEDQSIVASGDYKGLSLRELLDKHADAIMGPEWPKGKPFPILVKWLDCKECLSLQVHPPKGVAPSLGGEPKTENWYIAETEPGAALIVGLKKGVTREAFEDALASGTLEQCVYRYESHEGQSVFIPSGRLHAIDGGNFILEIQQNSDTTYRVYDWGRVGLDGNPRQLHVKESLQCIDYTDFEPAPLDTQHKDCTLAESDIFRLRKKVLNKGETLTFDANEEPRIVSVVKGEVQICENNNTDQKISLSAGTNILLPYNSAFYLKSEGPCITIITDHFNH